MENKKIINKINKTIDKEIKSINKTMVLLLLCILITNSIAYNVNEEFENSQFNSCNTPPSTNLPPSGGYSGDHFITDLSFRFDSILNTSTYISENNVEEYILENNDNIEICPGQLQTRVINPTAQFFNFKQNGEGTNEQNCICDKYPEQTETNNGQIIYTDDTIVCTQGSNKACDSFSTTYLSHTACGSGDMSYYEPFDFANYVSTESCEDKNGQTTIACEGVVDYVINGDTTTLSLNNLEGGHVLDLNELGEKEIEITINHMGCDGFVVYTPHDCWAGSPEAQIFYHETESIPIFQGTVTVVNITPNVETREPASVRVSGDSAHIEIPIDNFEPDGEYERGVDIIITDIHWDPSLCYDFELDGSLPEIPSGETRTISGTITRLNPEASPVACDDRPIVFSFDYDTTSTACYDTIVTTTTDGIELIEGPGPDYICDFTGMPYELNAGQTQILNMLVTNIGTGDGINYSKSNIRANKGTVILNENIITIPINSGAIHNVVTNGAVTCTGNEEIFIQGNADVANDVIEANESNNMCNHTIQCHSEPDYISECKVSDDEIVVGESTLIKIATKNIGDATTTNSMTNFFSSFNVPGDLGDPIRTYASNLGYQSIRGLYTGEYNDTSFEYNCTAGGEVYIYGYADYRDEIIESNPDETPELNNYYNKDNLLSYCKITCISNYTCIDYV